MLLCALGIGTILQHVSGRDLGIDELLLEDWSADDTPGRMGLNTALCLAILGVAYTLHALTFQTSTLSLLPQNAPYALRFQDYAKDFGKLEDVVVVVEAGSFAAALSGFASSASRMSSSRSDSGLSMGKASGRPTARPSSTILSRSLPR